ncbi:hypothetical protein C8J56DRAFT_916411 [Mycena floridula]|nr:hypothetical protein C8J56DRAFT_916411 [Mycena floridula]
MLRCFGAGPPSKSAAWIRRMQKDLLALWYLLILTFDLDLAGIDLCFPYVLAYFVLGLTFLRPRAPSFLSQS